MRTLSSTLSHLCHTMRKEEHMSEITETFEVTRADVEAYLATLEEEEEVGVCYKPSQCLIANVLFWKYPGYIPKVYAPGKAFAEDIHDYCLSQAVRLGDT